MKKETICVGVDGTETSGTGIAGTIHPSTAFQYLDEGDQLYPRYFNTPNQESVVRRLCRLESAEAGIVFSSGMAAVSTSMLALLKPADHIVMLNGIYGGTNAFVNDEFDRLGVQYSFVDGTPQGFEKAISDSTRVFYLESPTNPLMSIVDLNAIADIARRNNIITVIDNTFASPVLQNPITLGIDVVIHSGTKYLGGHSDLSCGVVLTNAELAKAIKEKALHYGGSLNAIMCYLLERSLKTLALRVNHQSNNAAALANFLNDHDHIQRVYYPGLPDHPGHEIAARQMSGFGAMMSFELAANIEVIPFMKSLRIVTAALSLGGVESTMCVPALTSHRHMSPESLANMGLNDRVIRFSVGAENVDDLQNDLAQAIKSAATRSKPVGSA